jgi:hypothetical protein
VLSLLPAIAVAADGSIQADRVSGKPGETVSVPVRLANNPGLVALQLKVSYDSSALTLVEIVDGGVLAGKNYNTSNLSKNPYTLDWNSDTADEDNTDNGVIATLRFAIAETAAGGTYPITVSLKESWNYDMSPVSFAVTGGAVTCAATEPQFDNRTNGVAVISDASAEGFTVTASRPCAAVCGTGDGYQLIPAQKQGDAYRFTLPDGFDADKPVVVAVKYDLNRDGEVNSTDALQILRVAVELRAADDADILISGGSGALTASDAAYVLRIAAGLETVGW